MFAKSSQFKDFFLIDGLLRQFLKDDGKIPCISEEFMMVVMRGKSLLIKTLRIPVGIGSKGQDFVDGDIIVFLTKVGDMG